MKRGSNLPSKETTLETDLPIPPKVSRARDPQKLPSVLRQLREQKKLSQRELARKMGLSRIQLQWMENRVWNYPVSLSSLSRLSLAA